jgi:hypothetical protein
MKLSNATIGKVLNALLDFGIIEETTGNKRNRLFCYNRYMNSLQSVNKNEMVR